MSNTVHRVFSQYKQRRNPMSRAKSVLPGFDYRIQKQVERSRADWKEELKHAVSRGGFRRVDHGETFGHGSKGVIEFEIYGNVNL